MLLFIPATLHPTNSDQAAKQYIDLTDIQTKYSLPYEMHAAEI